MSEDLFREEDLGSLFKKSKKREIKKCIVCSSTEFSIWSESRHYSSYKCNSCSLIFMSPQLCEEGLADYYNNYIGRRRSSDKEKMSLRAKQYKLDSIPIRDFLSDGKILDVGCNGGFFLNELGDSYERFGTEIDPEAMNYAKNNYPDIATNIHLGSLESVGFEKGTFNLVSMRGVIEHVMDPEATIAEVSRILANKGLLFICATPNGESLAAELYRENWTLFHPVQHLWHFSSKNLSEICERHNLKLVWKEYPYLGTPYENVSEDIKKVANKINNLENNIESDDISPPFYESMLTLMFEKHVI